MMKGPVWLLAAFVLLVPSADSFAQRTDERLGARADGKPAPRVNPAELATVERVARFYERVGMGELAERVRTDFKTRMLTFDPTVRARDPATAAEVDPYTNQINVDSGAVQSREDGVAGRNNIVSLASTIGHEYIHVGQGQLYILWEGKPTSETPAWTNQLQMARGWLRNRISALDNAQTPAERIEILKDIEACRGTIGSVLSGLRENIQNEKVERGNLTDQKMKEILADTNRVALDALIRHEALLTDPAYRRLAGNFGTALKDARALRAATLPPFPDGGTSLALQLPGFWGHLGYTINGAQLDPPTGGDRGKIAGRSYTGSLSGSVLSVSGTAISDNESSGPGSGDYYMLSVTVTVGKDTKTFEYIAPKGEKMSRPFSVSVPVAPGATSGSFLIKLLEVNRNYGEFGWIVNGSLAERK